MLLKEHVTCAALNSRVSLIKWKLFVDYFVIIGFFFSWKTSNFIIWIFNWFFIDFFYFALVVGYLASITLEKLKSTFEEKFQSIKSISTLKNRILASEKVVAHEIKSTLSE